MEFQFPTQDSVSSIYISSYHCVGVWHALVIDMFFLALYFGHHNVQVYAHVCHVTYFGVWSIIFIMLLLYPEDCSNCPFSF